jgi:hypothetical protein
MNEEPLEYRQNSQMHQEGQYRDVQQESFLQVNQQLFWEYPH